MATYETEPVTEQTDAPKPTPDSAPAEPKKPRRRFTPEERIANREAEIERIKERQRERVRNLIYETKEMLRDCEMAANSACMDDEAKLCASALYALNGNAKD